GANEQDAPNEDPEHLAGAPAERVRADDAPNDAEEADDRDHHAREVEPVRGALRLARVYPRERDGDEPDRAVEPEDPLPRDPGRERAADDRADRDSEAGDAAPR